MNPLDLRGPQFLAFYVLAVAVAAAGVPLLRHVLRGPAGAPDARHLALGPVEAGTLAGGPERGFGVAAARLAAEGAIRGDAGAGMLHATGQLPASAGPVERAIHARVKSGAETARVLERCEPVLDEVSARLVSLGLVLDAPAGRRAAALATAPVWAVAALGVAKVVVGLSRGRPVGFLVVLVVATIVLAHVLGARPVGRTRLGDATLARLRERHRVLRFPASTRAGKTSAPLDVALGVALFGPALLGAHALGDLATALRPPRPVSSSWGSGNDSGGSSCGTSGCSSSSCGGGSGCGGCGST